MKDLVKCENGNIRAIILAQTDTTTVVLNLDMKNPSMSVYTEMDGQEVREDFDFPQLNQRFRVDMAHVQEIAVMLINDREDV
jgi:hypothetical protein